jgi:hypothetical protein
MINALATTLFNAGNGKNIKRNNQDSTPLCNHQSGNAACGIFEIGINEGSNFAQAVLDNADGLNRAEMSVTVKMDCQEGGVGFDCGRVVTGVIKDALSLIPLIGIGAPQFINVACRS